MQMKKLLWIIMSVLDPLFFPPHPLFHTSEETIAYEFVLISIHVLLLILSSPVITQNTLSPYRRHDTFGSYRMSRSYSMNNTYISWSCHWFLQ